MKYSEYYEKKKHGTSDFPLEYYYITNEYPQYVMPLHWHSEFEIIRIISGKFSLFLNNIPHEMKAGDFEVIECGVLHRGEPKNCIYECLVFDLNMLRSKNAGLTDRYITPFLNHILSIKTLCHIKNDDLSESITALFNICNRKNPYYELEAMSVLFRFFSLLYSSEYISKHTQNLYNIHQIKIITELLDWIDKHYTEQIFLADLAKVSGLKEKYLCRFFKEYTTRTPIDYINRLRIDNACRDLAHLGCTVTEAAYNNGFNDLSYFSKMFKFYKGMTPKAFIKKQTISVAALTHIPIYRQKEYQV